MAGPEQKMMLRTGTKRRDRCQSAGFTLIELVLVMAILIVVLSMSGASLTSFFKGRTLESEGQRFLALTRYAQNRAVSEGLPMSLWIEPGAKKYGLEIATSFAEMDDRAKEFSLGRDLEIKAEWLSAAPIRRNANEIILSFTPDGYIDETNPELITIKEKNGESVFIGLSRNRLNYEITTNRVYAIRR
jgi:prepilin-type N-terminal cleavage/methylation domain-containing protein